MPKPLWAPWRLEYVQHADELDRCIFCEPERELLVHDGAHALVLLNKFPYSSGHLLVAPRRHLADFGALSDEEALEVHSPRGPGNRGASRRVRAARLQPRLEPRPRGRRRDRGSRPPARRPALERRHELHAGARRREGPAGAPPAHCRTASHSLRVTQLAPRRPRLAIAGGLMTAVMATLVAKAFVWWRISSKRAIAESARAGHSQLNQQFRWPAAR